MTIRSEMVRMGSLHVRLGLLISAMALVAACGGEGNTTLTVPVSDAAADGASDAKTGDGAAPDAGSPEEGGEGDASPEAETTPDAGADDASPDAELIVDAALPDVVLGDGASE